MTIPTIHDLLENSGPSLSSRLTNDLRHLGVTAAAARQRVARARGEVLRLKGIELPKREAFLYLKHQADTQEYWSALGQALVQTNSAYGVALSSLTARGGSCPISHFHVISGSPTRLKGHISSERVLSSLVQLGWIYEGDGQVRLRGFESAQLSKQRARLLSESVVLGGFRDWLRKLGLVSFEAAQIRTESTAPVFGQFHWDLTGPSYVQPLASFTGRKASAKHRPGFVVADVFLEKDVSTHSIEYFLRKCHAMRRQPRTRPFLAFPVADFFVAEAFQAVRKAGILLTTPEILFGTEVAKALRELTKTLTNAAAVAVKNPERVYDLFNALKKIEGASLNLRGALFELLVGHCVVEHEGGNLDIGQEITDPSGNRAEIDVLRVKGHEEVWAYECKGYGPGSIVKKDEVEKWLKKKVPIIRDWLLHRNIVQSDAIGFGIWTSAHFSDDALAFLENEKKQIRKYKIDWKDGPAVRSYAKKLHQRSIVKTLDEHFFRHPLAELSSS